MLIYAQCYSTSCFFFAQQISIIVWNAILLLRIIRGSDPSVKASGYGNVPEQGGTGGGDNDDEDNDDDYDASPSDQKQYTPPEY